MTHTRATLTALALTATLGLAGCSGGDADTPAAPPAADTATSAPTQSVVPNPTETMTDSPTTTTPTEQATTSPGATAAAGTFGPGCDQIPTSGSGSVEDMAGTQVGQAVQDNPLLSTLATAAQQAGILDTLNSAQDVTVFAPANTAFEAVDASQLTRLMADPQSLGNVLQYHVVQQRLSPDQVAGTHQTLAGQSLTVTGTGEDMTVGEGNARVLCGNVQTANATIYIIDGLLMP